MAGALGLLVLLSAAAAGLLALLTATLVREARRPPRRTAAYAVARGLPCVAAAVGGVPEYLDQDYLFNSADSDAIAVKVLDIMDDPRRLAAMSQQNVEASQAYTPEALRAVKEDFWRAVKESSSCESCT